ncbi:MBL fold metallo-hydrolase [Nonomuraea sp. NPDC049655]|uniref:MBL fold metallo-hydrolase n=1 Tax=Nonomuraea sp. NPDC049655 TaxID=3364355 RepID=UPI0037AFEABD
MLDHEGEAMRLTVLGCRAGMPSHGVASSGYLVTTAGTRLLLDCGPGTATALSGVTRPDDLSGILISHLHIDHCYDLLPLGRRILSGQLTAHNTHLRPPAIPLHVPNGGRDLLHSLAGLFSPSTAPILDRVFDLALDVREYQPGEEFQIGDCHISLHALRHAPPNCGSRIRGPAATLAYTGDTGVTDALHTLADADLLLAEATLDRADPSGSGHLTPADAARAAQAAGAAQLMLTHLPHRDATWYETLKAEAELHFDGPVHLATPGLEFDLA